MNPKGSCIGPMGARVRQVMSELGGEKIDIVDFSEDPGQMIAHALSPARVTSVEIVDREAKAARVARAGDASRFRNAQWYLMCNYQPVAQVASLVICDVAQTGTGGAAVQVACRVSQIVVVLWTLVC